MASKKYNFTLLVCISLFGLHKQNRCASGTNKLLIYICNFCQKISVTASKASFNPISLVLRVKLGPLGQCWQVVGRLFCGTEFERRSRESSDMTRGEKKEKIF